MEGELAERQIVMKELSDSFDEIISWSELYDSASFSGKKDDCKNAMITRIDVYRDYQLNIEFDFNIRQFFEGINEKEILEFQKSA